MYERIKAKNTAVLATQNYIICKCPNSYILSVEIDRIVLYWVVIEWLQNLEMIFLQTVVSVGSSCLLGALTGP